MTHHVQRIPVPALELLGADLPDTTDHAPVIGLSPALLADYSKHDRTLTTSACSSSSERRPRPLRLPSSAGACGALALSLHAGRRHDEPLDAQRGFPRSPSQLSQPSRVCVPRRAAQASNATACHHHLDW